MKDLKNKTLFTFIFISCGLNFLGIIIIFWAIRLASTGKGYTFWKRTLDMVSINIHSIPIYSIIFISVGIGYMLGIFDKYKLDVRIYGKVVELIYRLRGRKFNG